MQITGNVALLAPPRGAKPGARGGHGGIVRQSAGREVISALGIDSGRMTATLSEKSTLTAN